MNTKNVREVNEDALQAARDKPCIICGRPAPSDPSHIKTRGSGGPDTEWNVVPMCRVHHTEWGKRGCLTFIRKHPAFGSKLYALGWYLMLGKLWNDKLTLKQENRSESESPSGLRQELPKCLLEP